MSVSGVDDDDGEGRGKGSLGLVLVLVSGGEEGNERLETWRGRGMIE